VYVARNDPSRYLLLYNRSTDNGTTWLPENAIYNGSDIRTPSIAVSDSIVHVVWRDIQGNWATMYMRSTDSGTTWSGPEVLGPGIYPSITCNERDVCVIRDGNSGVGLLYRRSSDFGVTWSAETLLTTPVGGNFPYPSIGCTDSVVNIVWRDARDGNSEIYYKRCLKEGVWCEEDGPLSHNPLMFSIAPNFLGNSIRILCKAMIATTIRLDLFNSCGSHIWGKNIRCNGHAVCVEDSKIAMLPKGVYFLSLGSGNRFHISRVVKY
jgi:hypothetical protein